MNITDTTTQVWRGFCYPAHGSGESIAFDFGCWHSADKWSGVSSGELAREQGINVIPIPGACGGDYALSASRALGRTILALKVFFAVQSFGHVDRCWKALENEPRHAESFNGKSQTNGGKFAGICSRCLEQSVKPAWRRELTKMFETIVMAAI